MVEGRQSFRFWDTLFTGAMVVMAYQVEALVETARALGNLSRHADARRCMANLRLDEILVFRHWLC